MNPEAFFKITYGLYVVSSEFAGKMNGFVSNTVFQITANPEQFAVACSKKNLTAELISKSGRFSFSILHQNAGKELMGTFGYKSGRDIDKFTGFNYKKGKTGVPILLDDCIAWFECELVETFDAETHLLFIGTVIDNALIDDTKAPLTYLYYRNNRKGKAPENAPTYVKPEIKQPMTTESYEYQCPACGYIYNAAEGDPDGGIAPGTSFEDLPDDWKCPLCGMDKSEFEKH